MFAVNNKLQMKGVCSTAQEVPVLSMTPNGVCVVRVASFARSKQSLRKDPIWKEMRRRRQSEIGKI
jgi:hypothetical protein